MNRRVSFHHTFVRTILMMTILWALYTPVLAEEHDTKPRTQYDVEQAPWPCWRGPYCDLCVADLRRWLPLCTYTDAMQERKGPQSRRRPVFTTGVL